MGTVTTAAAIPNKARMGWGKYPALVLVDVCKAYWDPTSALDLSRNPAGAAAPDSMRRLLAAAREGKVPVIWTAVKYKGPDMSEAGLFYREGSQLTVFHEDDPRGLGAWVDGLTPAKEDTIIEKKFASAFFGTTLAGQLHVMGIDTVVMCGVSTSGCVRATTLDAMQSGFRPMVREAPSSQDLGADKLRLSGKRAGTVLQIFRRQISLI
jgi:nicotinamidase-related amidase